MHVIFAGDTPHPEGHSPTRLDTPSSQSVSPMMPQLSPGKPPVWAGADSFKHEAGQELLMITASPSPVGSGDLSGAAAAVAAGGALEPLTANQGPAEAHQVSFGGASKLCVALGRGVRQQLELLPASGVPLAYTRRGLGVDSGVRGDGGLLFNAWEVCFVAGVVVNMQLALLAS